MNCCEKHGIDCRQGRNCPARSCDALGVCQGREPRCEGCEPPSPSAQVYSVITLGLYVLFAVVVAASIGLAAGVIVGRM